MNAVGDKKEGQLVHPQKLIVWLLIASIVMVFAGLTSAHVVRKAEGNWLEFEMPSVFLVSTILIILSSVTGHLALMKANAEDFVKSTWLVIVTFLLGIGFLVTQLEAWEVLKADNVYFGGELSNPAGSFLYVFSGLHGAHIVMGLGFLLYVLKAVLSKKLEIQRRKDITEMGITFWHFLDGLWLCLYIFLIYNHEIKIDYGDRSN
ncbi:MAG: cytochrome oxidase subunit III [Cytophagales bacterium]|nr:cytochrome oxidase subunit III [Cytophagales bacterium]